MNFFYMSFYWCTKKQHKVPHGQEVRGRAGQLLCPLDGYPLRTKPRAYGKRRKKK